MDLNKRIAERRAELQREQAAEEEIRKQEEQARKDLQIAEEKARREQIEREAESRIQHINSRLQGAGQEGPPTDGADETSQERRNEDFGDDQKSINAEAQKRAETHIRDLAGKRMTRGEHLRFGTLFFGGITGFFFAWWLGLALWGWAAYYAMKVTNRHVKQIKSELDGN